MNKKAVLNRYLRKIYHTMPLPDEYKSKLKHYYHKNFQYLTQDISQQEWKAMNEPSASLKGLDQPEPGKYMNDLFQRAGKLSTEYVPFSDTQVELTENDIKLIAFYLPQFHPFPENDEWWGRGFTEWTNVSKAVPQFVGHHQPQLPGELGFYDLRLPEVQKRQIELAKKYGLSGFCYHHYWFSGKRLLERPVDQMLADPEMDFPFCLCWANENWTRRWDGMENDILMGQNYSPEDDLAFIRDLEPYLRDSRYIRINGRLLLVVYRVGLLPDPKETARIWREYCREAGLGELYLVAAQGLDFINPQECGFDAAVEFPPHTVSCPNVTDKIATMNPDFKGTIFDLPSFVRSKCFLKPAAYKLFKGVFPSWDNTARKPNQGTVFWGSSPEIYKEWLLDVMGYTRQHHEPEERIVFINAWNEWGEGAHLEPDRKYGYAYLQATAEAVVENRQWKKKKIILVSHDAHFHGAQLLALSLAKQLKEQFGYEVFLLLKSGGELESEFARYAKVYLLEQDYPDRQRLEGLIDALRLQGAEIAVCNTVVTGDVLRVLTEKNLRTVSLVHELPGIIKSYQQENNAAYIAEHAAKVIFPSNYVKDRFMTVVPELSEEKTCIRPQGLCKQNRYKGDEETARRELREELGLPQDALIMLGIGYADKRKGVDLFVDAAMQVIAEEPKAHFVWLGNRESSLMAEVKAKLRDFAAAEQIHFVDARDDIALFYAGADLYVMSSREDPFPCVVVDSMDVGLPVVGFADAGGFGDIVNDATGKLVPFLDTQAMADAILKLLQDDAKRQSLGEESRCLIEKNFQFTDYVYDLLSYLGHDYLKISAVVPNYNYGHYLEERLQTICEQDYPVYEILVLDDKSSDDSADRLAKFCEDKRPAIPVFSHVNEKNSGSVFKQWAKGMELSRGDYVWIAEADDLSLPGFLSEAARSLELDEKVVLSYTQSKQMASDGSIMAENYLDYTKDIDPLKWTKAYIREGNVEIADTLAVKNTIPNVSAVVFRKRDLTEIVGRLLEFKVAGDWCFYVWLLQDGKIAYSPEALNLHRRHATSVTHALDAKRHLDEITAMQDEIQENFAVGETTKAIVAEYRQQVEKYLLKA